MQMGQRQKSPGNKVLIPHRGSSSSPAFLKQAASVCVSAAAYTPLGGRWRLKRLEFGMSSQARFHAVLFGFLLLSVCGGSSVLPSYSYSYNCFIFRLDYAVLTRGKNDPF